MNLDDLIGDELTPPGTTHKTYGVARTEVAQKAASLDDLIGEELTPVARPAPQTEQGDFARGLSDSWEQLKQAGAGVVGIAGHAIGSEGMRDWGLAKYNEIGERVQAGAKASDDITQVGSADDLADFAQYWGGYLVGQLAQAVVTGGAGATVGKVLAQKGLKHVVAGQIEKAVAGGMARDAAVAAAGRKLGAGAGLLALNLSQETGHIYGDAVEEAERKGGTADDVNLGRVIGAGGAAAALDTAMDMTILGRLAKGGKGGIKGAAQSALAIGVKESATETGQSVIERLGADKELGSDDAIREYLNSAVVGLYGGSVMGGIGGARKAKEPTAPPAQTDPLAQLPEEEIEARPGERVNPDDDYVASVEQSFGVKLPPKVNEVESQLDALTARQSAQNGAGAVDPATYWQDFPPTDADVERAAAAVRDASKQGDLPNVEKALREMERAAANALKNGASRPAIMATLGEVQAEYEALIDRMNPPAERPEVGQGVKEMSPPDLSSVVGGLQRPGPKGLFATIGEARQALDAAAKARGANGEQTQLRTRRQAGITDTLGTPALTPAQDFEPIPPKGKKAALDPTIIDRIAGPAQTNPVPETTPEPQSDLDAQIAAMMDPANPKDAVWVAKGTKMPKVPKGVKRVIKAEGTLLTTNADKAGAFAKTKKITDELVAQMLGIPEPKAQAMAGEKPGIVEGRDAQGNVVAAAVTSSPQGPNVDAVAAQTPVEGEVAFVAPQAAQAKRAAKVAAEQGSATSRSDEGAAPAGSANEVAPRNPGTNEPTITPIIEVKGKDHNDEPATLHINYDGRKVADARIVYDDGSEVGIAVTKKDTVESIIRRVEDTGDFTRDPEQTTPQKVAEKPAPKEKEPQSSRQYTTRGESVDHARRAEEEAAMKEAASQINRKLRKNVKRDERAQTDTQAWVNEKLAPETGMKKSVTLVESPPKFAQMAHVMRTLFGQRVQFFSPVNSVVNAAFEGFTLPGDPDTIYVSVNVQNPALFVMGHEFGHNIRRQNPRLFLNFVKELHGIIDRPEARKYLDRLREQIRREDKRSGKRTKDVDIGAMAKEEIASDAIGSAFMDPEFWKMLSSVAKPEARPVIARMLGEVVEFLKAVIAVMRGDPSVRGSKLFKDTQELNRAVRDLLLQYADLRESLDPKELKEQAADFYVERMEPEDGVHASWEQLGEELQELWVESFDLWREGDITGADLIADFERLNRTWRTNEKIDDQRRKAEEREASQTRFEASRFWNNKRDDFEPKFEELTPEWQRFFVNAFAEDKAEKKVDLAKAFERATAGMKKITDAQQKRMAEIEATIEKQKQEQIAGALSVAAERMKEMTPAEKAKVAAFFEYKAWNGTVAKRFAEKVAEVMSSPADVLQTLPGKLRPIIRRILRDAPVRFSRRLADLQTQTPEFLAWFGDSKIVTPSGEPQVWYHGTSQNIRAFKPKQADAIFVTRSPSFAEDFAELSIDYARRHKLKDKRRTIYPLYIRAENPFDFNLNEHREALRRQMEPLFAETEDGRIEVEYPNGDIDTPTLGQLMAQIKYGLWNIIELPEVQDAIRALGHDGFYAVEGSQVNLAVYSPNQVKAAYGNSGAFSRTDDRIAFSRKDTSPAVEVYAVRGDEVLGLASYNPLDKAWSVWKADTDIRDRADLREQRIATTEDALNALRGKGIRLVRRKASPFMEGATDAWGRGPDALAIEIDNDPKPGSNLFTKGVDGLVAVSNKLLARDDSGADLRRRLVRWTQDAYIDVRMVQEHIRSKGGAITGASDLYQAITLYPGRTGAQMREFERTFSEPLEAVLEEAVQKGATIKSIERWLVARHAAERNAVIRKRTQGKNDAGSGMTDADAKAILAEQTAWDAELKQVGELMDRLSSFKIDVMEQSGLVSSEVATELRGYDHYVSLRGLDEDDTGEITSGFGIGTGTGFSGKGSLLKYATGRDTEASHVIAHTLLDAEAKIVRAGKNEVAKSLLKLAEDFPDPTFWRVAQIKSRQVFDPERGTVKLQADPDMNNPNMVVAYVNGEATRVEVLDDSFAHALTNAANSGTNVLLETMRRFNSWASQMVTTYNPVWSIVNGLRDAQTAYFNIKADPKLPKDMGAAVLKNIAAMKPRSDIWKLLRDPKADNEWARLYRELEQAGGITHFFGVTQLEDRARKLAAIELRAANKGLPAKVQDAWRKGRGPEMAQFLQDMGATIEAVPRVAAYKALIEAGWSKADAADYAKNLTVNFNRKGSQKALSSMYMFFNPAVQGTARLWTALQSPEGRAIAGGLMALGFLAGLTGNAAGDDDGNGTPDYQQMSGWERSTNLILWPNGPKIPLPYGWNAFYAIGNYAADLFYGRGIGHVLWNGVKAVSDAFDPIGQADSKNAANWLVKAASPTIVDPVVQAALNDNAFGSSITPEKAVRGFRPDSESGRSSVGFVWREGARALNRATGGSSTKAGFIDVNPSTLEHYFANYLPGWPQEAIKAASTALKMGRGEAMEVREVPVVRKVWAQPAKTDYDGLAEAKEKLAEIAAMSKGDAEDRSLLAKKYPGWMGVKVGFDANGKKVADLYKRRAQITDGKLKVRDEVAELKKIDDDIAALNNRMLRLYSDAKAKWDE